MQIACCYPEKWSGIASYPTIYARACSTIKYGKTSNNFLAQKTTTLWEIRRARVTQVFPAFKDTHAHTQTDRQTHTRLAKPALMLQLCNSNSWKDMKWRTGMGGQLHIVLFCLSGRVSVRAYLPVYLFLQTTWASSQLVTELAICWAFFEARPTDRFTTLEFQNSSQDVDELADLWNWKPPKLWKNMSGRKDCWADLSPPPLPYHSCLSPGQKCHNSRASKLFVQTFSAA